MQLQLPTITYKDSFITAVREYQATDSEDRKDIFALRIDDLQQDFPSYIESVKAESEGKNLPENYVPQTTYWLIDNDEFIGRVSIRHTLTEYLLQAGGHIGYDIRPSRRHKGYGKKILALALPKAKEIGITKVLVTCSETNLASKKIIEANGGIFENAIQYTEGQPKKLRYWIPL